MRIDGIFAYLVPLALFLGCGGNVVVDRDGSPGEGGSGGGVSGGSQGAGGICLEVDCEGDNSSCSCVTKCAGPKMRADCKQDGDTVICECHNDASYLGTCGKVTSSTCGLPDGCCLDYL